MGTMILRFHKAIGMTSRFQNSSTCPSGSLVAQANSSRLMLTMISVDGALIVIAETLPVIVFGSVKSLISVNHREARFAVNLALSVVQPYGHFYDQKVIRLQQPPGTYVVIERCPRRLPSCCRLHV